jgi:predicted nucleic acid-binding protein
MLIPLMRLPLRPLTAAALRLAVQHNHPIYDCYYLAAAILNDCELATADRRLAALARDVGLGDRVILIGASPARGV